MTDTVVLPRETVERIIDELERVRTVSGHRAQIVTEESRGHCPSSGICTNGCRGFVALVHELYDATGVPKPDSMVTRRRRRVTTDRAPVQPTLGLEVAG